MHQSQIQIDVTLDESKVPEKLAWSASDSTASEKQEAKAMFLSFWDGNDKAALRIDLWTKEMMVDEMIDFFYQCLMGMSETLLRSTGQQPLAAGMQSFAQSMLQQFQAMQRQQAAQPAK